MRLIEFLNFRFLASMNDTLSSKMSFVEILNSTKMLIFVKILSSLKSFRLIKIALELIIDFKIETFELFNDNRETRFDNDT
jgi:hypothetical protein